jgi:signal-transduction protein with cAMP-binding, CBS, and nucleotidyltransferase domain
MSTPTMIVHHQSPTRTAAERNQRDEETGKLADYLRTIPPLNRYLLKQDFEFMALNAFRRCYSAGEHVLIKGSFGDALFIIQEGSCEVTLPTGNKLLGPGDYIGEMSMLKSGERSADVVAGPAGSALIRIDRACMEALFRYHPALLQEFVKTRDTRHQETNAGHPPRAETSPPLWGRARQMLRHYLLPW